jgi:formate--tetrahydrofolate ligase
MFPTDLEIAQNAPIRPIQEIAAKLGISSDDIEQYGKYKAKLPLSLINEEKIAQSNLILVSALNPTMTGEGKTMMFSASRAVLQAAATRRLSP